MDKIVFHLGMRVSELCSNDFVQLSLMENHNEKKKQLDKAIDNLRMKFGSKAVYHLLKPCNNLIISSSEVYEHAKGDIMGSSSLRHGSKKSKP